VTIGGAIDPGETPAQAAARETLEETGWQPGPLSPLVRYQPTNGVSDQSFHIFVADGATHIGEPTDKGEAERVEWVSIADLRRLVQDGQMLDGLSLTSVLYALAFDAI
jgi:8-oxo-dGTP pyrophosphatase MutT (NUDIX family)